MKDQIRIFLEHPAIGWPLHYGTKAFLFLLQKTSKFLTRIYSQLPYSKRLQHLGTPDTFKKIYVYLRRLKNACSYLGFQPKISIIIPVYKVKPEYLRETLLSIAYQTYDHWEACIVDDCSGMPELTTIIDEFKTAYPHQVKCAINKVNSHISVTSNHCLELATGQYCALLDHDDRLLPHALGEMVRAINWHHEPDILYSDERTVNDDGWPFSTPFYKPDWSPTMHLAMNYTTHLTVYKTSLMREVGGFRQGFEGSQDHDLMLRMTEASQKPVIHVPLCLYQWRAHEQSTARGGDAKPYAATAGEKAVHEACLRRSRPAEVAFEPETAHYRVKFELKQPLPLVSVIISSKDAYDQVYACLRSIFTKSTYKAFEVILVDNGSMDGRCFDLYEHHSKTHPRSFRLLKDPRPANGAAQNHVGVEAARGDYLLFLSHQTEVVTRDWIEELLRLAQLPEVGAVGCKLIDPDGHIQHAGFLGAGRDIVVPMGSKLNSNHNIYWQMLQTTHETIAVTAACMMVAKSKYVQAQGFDEMYLENAYGDVDFCLKLRAKGYTNLFTPYATLTYHKSQSCEQTLEDFEKQTMVAKWGQTLISDPYLNPNLNYGEYYLINQTKLPMDMNWNLLDPAQMPLGPEALQLSHMWRPNKKVTPHP